MEQLRRSIFSEEYARRDKGLCPFCGKEINLEAFRDELSRKEFNISGLCQTCQDETFK